MNPSIYLDEDISPLLAEMLRDAGFDAVSAHDIGMKGQPDDAHFERARAEGRIVVSCNHRDFRNIGRRAVANGLHHPGILVSFHQYSRAELSAFRAAIVAFLADVPPEAFANAVLVVPRAR